jgi:PAS domain-containing protein
MLIVVPEGLRRDVFAAYHAAPSAGHLRFYKTLHRLRSRFFWPRMRSDIFEWCRSCAYCIATNSSIRKSSELVFSWPVSQPFYVLHVDLWVPGKTTATWDGSTHVLAAMCDLTGFVVSLTTSYVEAEDLARQFMQDILLKIGLCGLIVVDADSKFLGSFEVMCKLLGLRLHSAARSNHKAMSVERFFRSLNKAVTIASNDRGTNDVFVEAVHCFTYAWNASVIDGTDIVRSVAALGREFKFPLDIQLSSEPVPMDGDVSTLHAFLRAHQDNARIANEFLKVITEDRRCYHRERMNQDQDQVLFKVDDVVMVRVQVQSNANLDRVAKLSYRLRGPMIVKEVLGNGAYSVTRLDNPDGLQRKYHAQDLSLLPPVLWPVEPLDGPDLRYLNSNHAPLPHPLAQPFNIKLYNELWLSDPIPSGPPHLVATRPAVITVPDNEQEPSELAPPNSSETIQDEFCSSVPIEDSDVVLPEQATDSAILFRKIELSKDQLFFISYRLPGTLRAKWFLVAVDLTQTNAATECCGDPTISGTYFVHFYGRHPSDDSDSDCDARWWPLWHEFVIAADGVIDYGKRVLVPPSQPVDQRQLLPWGECVTLLDQSIRLLGPFDFLDPSQNPPGRSVRSRQYVPRHVWVHLSELCSFHGLQLPCLLPLTASQTKPRRNRKRKMN